MWLLLKNLLFILLVPGTVAGYIPWLLVRNKTFIFSAWTPLAAAAFLAGVVIFLWCVWDFAVFGRGTPAPIDAPKKLVVRGLYQYVRNPMYVGVLTVILGWAILFKAVEVAVYGVSIAAAFHLFVVFYEEPRLEKTFGLEYDEYRSRVDRWIPKIKQDQSAVS
ncbi:MAG: isoprenylcysteine carboxylmethyltransferase family protein [Betaproteobacteria bacterium]|nr:isoprenylcysteine carboxylmethyltransferase family protein [Betaproteobacteria bacterium]